MRTLRALFLGLQFREKLLLVAFVVLIVGVWGSSFNRRVWQFKRAATATTLDLGIQQRWLDNQSTIEATVKKTAALFDRHPTLDATSLLATISSLANEAGLNQVRSGESRDETNGQFNVHTREFTIDKADQAALIKFYLSLQARSPSIGIERYTQQPEVANPALSRIALTVSAPEVVR